MAHLLTTHRRTMVPPDSSRALSEGGTPADFGPQLQCFVATKRGLSPSFSKCILFWGITP